MKIVFLINNTIEVLMLLVVLNSFLTNVIGLVTKNSAILWA
ncbi:transcriptional regulator [Raoultella planticola]|nr:transcriptional regulator [Raoultella planticola]